MPSGFFFSLLFFIKGGAGPLMNAAEQGKRERTASLSVLCTDLANHFRAFTRDVIAQPKSWEDFTLQSTGCLGREQPGCNGAVHQQAPS